MTIRVLLFASLREQLGRSEVLSDLEGQATCETLRQSLALAFPEIRSTLEICRVAVNRELSPWERVLEEGEEVAFLPPVSGG